jgi:hypothetical protein
MSLNPPHSKEDLVKIDVRKDGGGIIKDKYEDAKKLNPEVQWLDSTGDYSGQIYPGNAVDIIKLPVSILSTFTEIQLKELVNACVPVGVMPLIRYYGYTPEIVYIGPHHGNGEILVQWKKMGIEFTYSVWYAKNPKGPWIRANTTRLTDASINDCHQNYPSGYNYIDYNEFIITGLEDKTNYSVKVTCDDKYYQWWYSYSGYDSIEGGYGDLSHHPSPDGGNVIGFKVIIVI